MVGISVERSRWRSGRQVGYAREPEDLPAGDLRIVDPDMKEAPRDGVTSGEVVVRAPWLTNGYFNNPEASEQLWAGGYLHTSDIGVITPDGYLQITDRIKDVIKTGGEWTSSLQLEDIIMHRAGVAECAVIGVKDARWEERPLALIVRDPKTEPAVTEEEIKAHVFAFSDKGVISKFAVPQKILFVDALAKTSVGKFDKRRCAPNTAKPMTRGADQPGLEPLPDSLSEEAARNTLALNPLVGLRVRIWSTAPRSCSRPWSASRSSPASSGLYSSASRKIGADRSNRTQPAGDKRFADPTWKNSAAHRKLLQTYSRGAMP